MDNSYKFLEKNSKGMIFGKIVSFTCINYPQLLFLHYLYFRCGPGYFLRWIVLVLGFWVKYLAIITVTPLLNTCKPPDPITDRDDSHTSGLKIRVNIWMRTDIFPVWYFFLCWNFYMSVFIGVWDLLRLCRVTIYPFNLVVGFSSNLGSI